MDLVIEVSPVVFLNSSHSTVSGDLLGLWLGAFHRSYLLFYHLLTTCLVCLQGLLANSAGEERVVLKRVKTRVRVRSWLVSICVVR